MRNGCLGVFALLLVIGVFVKYWYVAVPVLVIVAILCWINATKEEKAKHAAQEALRAEVAERERQAELEQAQLQYHQNALAAADPVYTRFAADLAVVPESRPADRTRIEREMVERLVVIDRFAQRFAELERTGQPVPDHGETMQQLVEKERAWDSRLGPKRRRPG